MTKKAQSTEPKVKIGCPRTVVRIWGMIAAISYISTGGYAVSLDSGGEKCIGAGVYMIVVGVVMLFVECPFCFIFCPPERNCFETCEEKFPFWAKGIVYLLISIPCLALCFGLKTLLSSMLVIILALLYFFLTCIVRSKRYERLRGEVKAQYKEKKGATSVGYSALSSTVTSFKPPSATKKMRPKGRKERGNPQQGATKV